MKTHTNFFRLTFILLVLIKSQMVFSQSVGNGCHKSYIYTNADYRLGELYGFGIQCERLLLDASLGSIYWSRIKDGITNTKGISKDKQKGISYSFNALWILSKDHTNGGFFTGLSYTGFTFIADNSNPALGEIICRYVQATVDPVFGYTYSKPRNLFFSVKVGYGIQIKNITSICYDGKSYSNDEFLKITGTRDISMKSTDLDLRNLLSCAFLEIKIGYVFNL